MQKIKSIKTKLSKIYHHMLDCYLNNNVVLDDIDIKDNNIKITFIEPAGSGYIKTLQDQIEESLFQLEWVESIEFNIKLHETATPKINEGLDLVKNVIAVSSCKGRVGKINSIIKPGRHVS